MKFLFIPTLLVLNACASLDGGPIGSTALGEYYKRDLKFTVNGEEYEGLAVLNARDTYSFSIRPEKPFDLFTATTCHREIDANQVTIERKKRWFGASSKKAIRFNYTPRIGVETETYCGLEMGIYDKDNGQEYWAFIDFVHDMPWNLGATIYCNGDVLTPSNSGICQSRIGLEQKIVFNREVEAVTDCLVLDQYKGRVFRWNTPPTECLTLFFDGEEYFRMTTFGYSRIKIKDYGFE